jgi:putative ABC transport system permease protein
LGVVSLTLEERPVRAFTGNGGFPARRAVVRWAWRLLRREWRQQVLILSLVTVAVAATFVGAAVATNTQPVAGAGFGTAADLATYKDSSPKTTAAIAALAHRFGTVDVVENQTRSVPGSVASYTLRAQNPDGAYGRPMLALESGSYPRGAGQVALTNGVATELRLKVGDTWLDRGQARRVVGIVSNPQNLLDDFALVAPGQVATPSQVVVLFDAPGINPATLGGNVTARGLERPNVINPATISIVAITLGMVLVALVSVAGFTVLAQRRLRAIGMLGAQGATDTNVGLVVAANGFATGVVGAVAGAFLGLVGWLAYRPAAQASAHHTIGAFELPWRVIAVSMGLAILATTLAALRPALAIARVPIVSALAGQPPPPRAARRLAGPVGIGLLVLAFFLIGLASTQAAAAAAQGSDKSSPLLVLVGGLVALCAGVVVVAPTLLGLLNRVARRAPISLRLAVRDLARYRARSGAALGAISLSLLIAVIICVVAAARFGNALDYVGPNLEANQLILHTLGQGTEPPPGATVPTAAQLAAMPAAANAIAASLASAGAVELETTDSALQRAVSGRNWNGAVYVATPELLRALGIPATQVSSGADVLTMRPGLASLTRMQLLYGAFKFGGPPQRDTGAGGVWPCPPTSCVADPKIVEVSQLPAGTSAPNTLITESTVNRLHLTTTPAGWLIETPRALTPAQISAAQSAAAAAGLAVESRNDIPSSATILNAATVFGILLALGILAMSVGLLRSETSGDVALLSATGASSTTRRAVSAATAGTLAVLGAVVGVAGGYLAAIGFFRSSQLDTLSGLTSVPVANLLLILVGMPLVAAVGSWLLAGREPHVTNRALA